MKLPWPMCHVFDGVVHDGLSDECGPDDKTLCNTPMCVAIPIDEAQALFEGAKQIIAKWNDGTLGGGILDQEAIMLLKKGIADADKL